MAAGKIESNGVTPGRIGSRSNSKGLLRYLGCFHSLLLQPPNCLFLLSLVLICAVLFPIGIYVENNSDIPNLDIMIVREMYVYGCPMFHVHIAIVCVCVCVCVWY